MIYLNNLMYKKLVLEVFVSHLAATGPTLGAIPDCFLAATGPTLGAIPDSFLADTAGPTLGAIPNSLLAATGLTLGAIPDISLLSYLVLDQPRAWRGRIFL